MRFRSLPSLFLFLAILPVCHAQVVTSGETIALTVGKAKWYLQFPSEDFTLKEKRSAPDGTGGYYFFTSDKSHLNVSFYIEPSPGVDDPAALRDRAWEKEQVVSRGAIDIEKSEGKGYATIAYTIPEFQGKRIDQRSMHVHYLNDGYWIDLHISRILYEPGMASQFDAFVKSISFVAKDAIETKDVSTSMEYFLKGGRAFHDGEYAEAVTWYSRDLELEKKEQTLKDEYWKVLVDNLGMAQALSGDLAAAKQTFEYGISRTPTYPMFYYNLACTYAEMEDQDGAIANLKHAYEYRANMIEGERLPDPKKDSSFQRFAKSEKFRQAMKDLGVEM